MICRRRTALTAVTLSAAWLLLLLFLYNSASDKKSKAGEQRRKDLLEAGFELVGASKERSEAYDGVWKEVIGVNEGDNYDDETKMRRERIKQVIFIQGGSIICH